jgi:hypothetical protein
MFFWNSDKSKIEHVGIVIDSHNMIDSSTVAPGGVQIRSRNRVRPAFARRVIIEEAAPK